MRICIFLYRMFFELFASFCLQVLTAKAYLENLLVPRTNKSFNARAPRVSYGIKNYITVYEKLVFTTKGVE